MGRRSKFLFMAIAVMALAVMLAAASGCGKSNKELTPTDIGEYNKPGTVLVETTWTADVTVPELAFDQDALVAYLVNLAQQGVIDETWTDEEIGNEAIAELITNPQLYLVATTSDRVETMESSVYGSGIIVTDDGYIVTNAHVVKASDEDLRLGMAEQMATKYLAQDLADFESALGIDLPEEYENRFLTAAASLYSSYMTVSDPKSKSNMYLVSVGNESVSDPMVAEKIEVGDPININEDTGKDVAVLKVNGSNLPTVAVGDDANLRGGEQAVALGYPSAGTFNPMFDLTKDLTPTLTQGTISGRKTMEGGWEVIQTDASIAHGSSGGPLFNDKAEAVAINTFGGLEYNEQTGEYDTREGFGFAVPTTVINEFLERANVTPALGSLTQTYREGIDLFMDQHYSASKKKFEQVRDANAEFPYVQDYIEQSTAKISAGEDVSTFPKWILIIVIIAGVVLIGVIVLVVVLATRKGGKKTPPPGAQTAATAAPMPPTPAQPQTPAPGAETPGPADTGDTPATETPAPGGDSGAATMEMLAPETPAAEDSGAAGASTAGEDVAGASGDTRFCSKCGNELDAGSEFCSKCGKQVNG
jgi:S1-C subfamily serine protease